MVGDALRFVLVPAMMAFAASTDLFTQKISNFVPAALALGFFVLAALDGMPIADVGGHFAVGLAVLSVATVFFARGWCGGGDVKLAAATALWFGSAHVLDYLLYTSLLGGALTLLVLEFRRRELPPMLANQAWLTQWHQPTGGVPYGIALASAALLVYPSTAWLHPAAR